MFLRIFYAVKISISFENEEKQKILLLYSPVPFSLSSTRSPPSFALVFSEDNMILQPCGVFQKLEWFNFSSKRQKPKTHVSVCLGTLLQRGQLSCRIADCTACCSRMLWAPVYFILACLACLKRISRDQAACPTAVSLHTWKWGLTLCVCVVVLG